MLTHTQQHIDTSRYVKENPNGLVERPLTKVEKRFKKRFETFIHTKLDKDTIIPHLPEDFLHKKAHTNYIIARRQWIQQKCERKELTLNILFRCILTYRRPKQDAPEEWILYTPQDAYYDFFEKEDDASHLSSSSVEENITPNTNNHLTCIQKYNMLKNTKLKQISEWKGHLLSIDVLNEMYEYLLCDKGVNRLDISTLQKHKDSLRTLLSNLRRVIKIRQQHNCGPLCEHPQLAKMIFVKGNELL